MRRVAVYDHLVLPAKCKALSETTCLMYFHKWLDEDRYGCPVAWLESGEGKMVRLPIHYGWEMRFMDGPEEGE